jgi:phospholipase/lecithinase/hemolysin
LGKANVTIFDTYKLFDTLLDNPSSALGSNANTTGFCNVCDRDGECDLCPNLENYAFWDRESQLLGRSMGWTR